MNWFEILVLVGMVMLMLGLRNVEDAIREVVQILRVTDLRGRL